MEARSRSARIVVAIAAACVVSLAAAAGAQAATTIAITLPTDPVESIPTQVGVHGTADTDLELFLDIKPAGAAGCGANFRADTSQDIVISFTASGTGSYSDLVNHTFDTAGSYVLCAWIGPDASDTTAAATMPLTVRIPHLSLTLAAPATVAAGATFQFSYTAQAETARTVFVGAVPDTGRGCAANRGALLNTSGAVILVSNTEVVGGPTTTTVNDQINAPGHYLVCGYFQNDSSDTVPEATATGAITVLPPCVVPQITPGSTVASAKAKVVAAGCTPKLRYVASSLRARGTVISVSPRFGTQLASGANVSVIVSLGAPCVVPHVLGHTLASAEKALAKADCTVGTVRHAHSNRYGKGRVSTLSPGAGSRLKPRATVDLTVSTGRARRRH